MTPRLILSLAAAALMAAVALATPAPVYREPPKPKVPEITAAVQGTWEVQQNLNAFRGRGGIAPRQVTQMVRIQNNTWATLFNINGVERESTKYEMVLDPKAMPATLDLKYNNGNVVVFGGFGPGGVVQQQTQQIAMKGIVKVEGDTLTFTYVQGYNVAIERPRMFGDSNGGMQPGVNAMTMTLKRVR